MAILKQVTLKEALNYEGKAIVISPDFTKIGDISEFGQDFRFVIDEEFVPIKEAFNYEGEGKVRAITPKYDKILLLEDFAKGFFFQIVVEEEAPSRGRRAKAVEDEKPTRSKKDDVEDASEGEEEISVIVEEDD